jgi:hemerythrin-like domain-containing protein
MEINIIKQLTEEHRIINRIADVMDTILKSLEDERIVPHELILADLHMLMECSYQYHLWKLEEIILPYLEKMEESKIKSKLVLFLEQYKSGTQYITAIIDAMETYDQNNIEKINYIMENGYKYLEQVHPIFVKEDKEIIDMLKEILNDEELSELWDIVKEFEYSWNGPSSMNYQMMIRELERKAVLSKW